MHHMTDAPSMTGTGISRRTVAAAALWSVPVLSLAVPAPAYAASPGKCYTMTWTTGTVSGRDTAYKTASYTANTSTVNGQRVPVRVTSSMTAGSAAAHNADPVSLPSGTTGSTNLNFTTWTAGSQKAVGYTGLSTSSNNYLVVPPGSTQSVLVLNQGSFGTSGAAASQTLTLTFDGGQKPKSVSMNIYDITAVINSSTPARNYTDQVIITGGTVAASPAVGAPVTVSGGTLTGTTASTTAGSYVPVQVTGLTGSTLTLVYRNAGTPNKSQSGDNRLNNPQYIALGDVRVCY